MGEAKKRQDKMINGPCICGSNKVARACCFTDNRWHKAPVILGLKSMSSSSEVQKCYMRELGSCEGGISGEHLISESIIELLSGDEGFTVAGLPWIPPGEFKTIGIKSLTANCLCRRHNSALSPLDTAALRFFKALKSCLERDEVSIQFIASGHDLERWLLKTLKAMAASGNLGSDGEKHSGDFLPGINILDLLDDAIHWPDGAGLYCVMSAGDLTENHQRFRLAPLSNQAGQLIGLWANILGLSFVLLLEPPDAASHPLIANALFRPAEISVSHPVSKNWLVLSWEDRRQHKALTLEFVRKVDASA